MKKSTATLSLILFTFFSGFAQSKDAEGDGSVAFGIKAGVTFPAFAISGATLEGVTSSSLTSYYAGVIVDIPIVNALSIQPGLSVIGKGTSLSSARGTTTKLTPLYLEIPINLIVGIPAGPGKFFLGAGPYWALGIVGNVKTTGKGDVDLKFGSGDTKNLKLTDYGLNFLLGYQLQNGLSINTGYGLGLTNIQPDAAIDKTYKSGVFSLGLGFIF